MIKTAFELLYRWCLRAAWAPIGVVVVQQLFSRSYETDWLMHFFGGAAMAFFFYQGILVFDSFLGRPQRIVRHLVAFGLTCGVVIAWELGELASDRLIGRRFQATIVETMVDQFSGVVGSILLLSCIAVVGHLGRRSDGEPG